MATINELIKIIENNFPPSLQENYDNSGFILGDKNTEISAVLITIDINEKVVEEAMEKKCNLIISHHPIIFHPIKKITGSNYIERTIIKAIKNDIAIYCAHTSVDNSFNGLNKIIAEKIGLQNIKIIAPKENILKKIVVFVPISHAEIVRQAILNAGAGHIGNYDSCSFNIEGVGTFKAGENTNPYVGEKGELHYEAEQRIETIFPDFLTSKIIKELKKVHPYEEVAFDIYPVENKHTNFGSGIIGDLINPMTEIDFFNLIKNNLNLDVLKYSQLMKKDVKRVAICSGACHFLIKEAKSQNADVFISSEFKYDQYISAQDEIVLIDAGHYETEIFIKKLFYDLITKKFTNFAVKFSDEFKNPVNYF